MSIISKNRVKYLILAVFSLIIAFGAYVSNHYSQDNSTRELALYSAFNKAVVKIQDKWKFGSTKTTLDEVGIECKSLIDAKDSLSLEDLRCNPEYLECIYSAKIKTESPIINVKHNNQVYEFRPIRLNDKFINYSGKNKFQLKVTSGGKHFTTNLKQTCHEVKLPENVYSFSNEMYWDNKNRNIYIDRFYVNNHDVKSWQLRTGRALNTKVLNDYNPSIDLNIEDRKYYCHSLGKRLLRSHHFEAVANYYVRRGEKIFTKYNYPWGKKKNSFLGDRIALTEENCNKAYVKGCEKLITFKNKIPVGMGQEGVSHTLGSYLEVFDNLVSPRENLKVSSFVISRSSEWHRVGTYAKWNGENFNESDIDWGKKYPRYKSGKLPIAFRCEREKL